MRILTLSNLKQNQQVALLSRFKLLYVFLEYLNLDFTSLKVFSHNSLIVKQIFVSFYK